MTREERLQRWFGKLDSDGDGRIDQTDLDYLVQQWCMASSIVPGCPQWREIVGGANRLWQRLASGDGNGDGTISAEEFRTVTQRPDFVDQVLVPFESAALLSADADASGRVGLNEWMNWHVRTGTSQIEAVEQFQGVDADGDGYLTSDEYTAHLKEMCAS
ncbi:EF-hand domain-containing protein [Streptomyces ficellus]|uniref:EF-hand domain-containing protein n=1 Tax=Streptomyces ficellus TaxID=1977088 RepID=A0ABT7Z1P3_9ACTN|nr:EF-hand domain-containing protein [Streptomyces ficellus]MDN3293417.1 EF-hand domain-containing protein [Streptomyces ficellus]